MKYGLSPTQLDFVIAKLAKINKVPKGYHYPELLLNEELSSDMQEMLARKHQH